MVMGQLRTIRRFKAMIKLRRSMFQGDGAAKKTEKLKTIGLL